MWICRRGRQHSAHMPTPYTQKGTLHTTPYTLSLQGVGLIHTRVCGGIESVYGVGVSAKITGRGLFIERAICIHRKSYMYT